MLGASRIDRTFGRQATVDAAVGAASPRAPGS